MKGHSCGRILNSVIRALLAACICLGASAQGVSVLTAPVNGQQNVSANATFQWTTSATAQAYYLYVGTTQGGKDVVNTGPIQGMSYTVKKPLPTGATLWARIWTELNGAWSWQGDISFTVSSASVMIYPVSGGQNVDTSIAFQWAPVSTVQAYRLCVGTSPGTSELVDTGAIQATSWSVPPLPVGQTLYARIWSEINGSWTYSFDIPFTAALRFGYPSIRAAGIDPAVAFTWSPAYGGNGIYHLSMGTAPGQKDLYDNTQIGQNSFTVPGNALPTGTVLYASIGVTTGDGIPRTAYTVFTVSGTPVAPSQMVYPADGMTNADVSQPFQWTQTDMAQAYRLQISNGSSTVVDSGPITVPRYFAETLSQGAYTGQIGTEIGGQWYWSGFSFVVTNTGPSMDKEIASALWATDYVRNMADFYNHAYSWTKLASSANPYGRLSTSVNCADYRNALFSILSEMNVAGRLPTDLRPRSLNIGFDNVYATHTLVEFWDSDLQRWMLLDPTFDLTVVRPSDETWATKEDVNASTLNQAWSSVNYQFLGALGDSIAKAYYLDYPLLYLNILTSSSSGPERDLMAYLVQQPDPPINRRGIYYFQCSGSTTLVINGISQQVACNQIDSLSIMYGANTIALPAGSNSDVKIYSPVRNVF